MIEEQNRWEGTIFLASHNHRFEVYLTMFWLDLTLSMGKSTTRVAEVEICQEDEILELHI